MGSGVDNYVKQPPLHIVTTHPILPGGPDKRKYENETSKRKNASNVRARRRPDKKWTQTPLNSQKARLMSLIDNQPGDAPIGPFPRSIFKN